MNQAKFTAEPGKQEFFIERELDAPRELVFKAFTDPNLYVQWLGPRGITMTLVKFEPRTGGMWRYISKDKDGTEFGFHGVNHEVLAPERIIDTFEYEGLPEKGHVALQTARFVELPGGRTKVMIQAVFQSVADRDGMIQSGAEKGTTESYQRLDDLLEKMERQKEIVA
ncbi:MAG TPA: SRPBCC family protein [Candidatus Bathyarchaeia archaeon]|nr:SRPBCC family protein [Candidatus Bathyarchaeia archaeon]